MMILSKARPQEPKGNSNREKRLRRNAKRRGERWLKRAIEVNGSSELMVELYGMINYDDFEVKTYMKTCPHHAQHPYDESYAACTCSATYTLGKKKNG